MCCRRRTARILVLYLLAMLPSTWNLINGWEMCSWNLLLWSRLYGSDRNTPVSPRTTQQEHFCQHGHYRRNITEVNVASVTGRLQTDFQEASSQSLWLIGYRRRPFDFLGLFILAEVRIPGQTSNRMGFARPSLIGDVSWGVPGSPLIR